MANRAKAKGDKAEREAVALLKDRLPDLVNHGAKRELGAGRAEDIGDIVRVVPHTVVQVKSYAAGALATGLRTAAKGASAQLANAVAQGYPMRFSLGMVPIPNAPTTGSVRWLATCQQWPTDLPVDLAAAGGPVRFTSVVKLIAWLKDDTGPHGYRAWPRQQRIATHGLSLTDTVLVAPIEAWLAAYREAIGAPAEQPPALPGDTVPGVRTEDLVDFKADFGVDFEDWGQQAVAG